MGQRFCLTLDLVDDETAIAAYEEWHRAGNVPAVIVSSIRDAGIGEMEIFRIDNRLVMIIDASSHFSFERKAVMDATNPAVIDWEESHARLPAAKPECVRRGQVETNGQHLQIDGPGGLIGRT